MSEASAPQHRRPLWLAALLTCVIVPLGYFALLMAVSLVTHQSLGEETARAFGYTLMFGVPVSAGAMLLLGLPVVFMLRSMNALRAVPVCIGAALAGALALALLFAMTGGDNQPTAFLWGGVVGVFAGVVFCAIAGIPWRAPRA